METNQLTKRECLKMLQGLRAMDNIAQEVEVKLEFKLTYAVAKNVRQLEGIEKDIETGVKKTKIYLEYEKKKMEIAEKHAVRDKNGNAIRRARIISGQQREYFEMPNDPDKIADFESDAKTLDLEYDECIKARDY